MIFFEGTEMGVTQKKRIVSHFGTNFQIGISLISYHSIEKFQANNSNLDTIPIRWYLLI